MQSPLDDRTARARIRDEALRLFADNGADAVTLRDIAAAAAVSPALVIRHYGSKDGLREAVDDHVTGVFEAMIAEATSESEAGALEVSAAPSLAEAVAASLPADSAIPAYLGRMLLAGGPAGAALFRRLTAVSRSALDRMVASGTADAGTDPEVRAAFLLANDLAVMILRERLREVLGTDPLSPQGLQRWGSEVLSIYRNGLGGSATGRIAQAQEHEQAQPRTERNTTGERP